MVLGSRSRNLEVDSNVYEKSLQGSYANACGFQTRILQVEEMSNISEKDGDEVSAEQLSLHDL